MQKKRFSGTILCNIMFLFHLGSHFYNNFTCFVQEFLTSIKIVIIDYSLQNQKKTNLSDILYLFCLKTLAYNFYISNTQNFLIFLLQIFFRDCIMI
jgi:hypothetical protein